MKKGKKKNLKEILENKKNRQTQTQTDVSIAARFNHSFP